MDNEELERFREQWRSELQKTAKHDTTTYKTGEAPQKAQKAPSSPTTTRKTPASPPTPRAPAPAHVRAPSFSAGAVQEDGFNVPGERRRPPRTALEHFELAVEYENEGNQGMSLEHYRKAFRLDERVDLLYREKHFPKASYVPPKDAPKPSITYSVDSLAKSFAGVSISGSGTRIEGTDGSKDIVDSPSKSPLSAIPSEILLHIFRHVAASDIGSYARLAQVCKAFAYIVTTEEQVWKEVCDSRKGFNSMVWRWACDPEGGEVLPEDVDDDISPIPENEEQVELYGGSWRTMFRDRPRIHFNGVYISTCNYIRQGQGSATSVHWNTPVHIVTYYRFLRFYPDGTCISLLSIDSPSHVVPEFKRSPPSNLDWSSKLQKGRWKMSIDGSLEVETIPDSPGLDKYTFHMAFTIKTASGSLASSSNAGVGGRRNRLIWRGYWSRNKITEDIAEFARKHDKPYVFSRVKWIERQMDSLGY